MLPAAGRKSTTSTLAEEGLDATVHGDCPDSHGGDIMWHDAPRSESQRGASHHTPSPLRKWDCPRRPANGHCHRSSIAKNRFAVARKVAERSRFHVNSQVGSPGLLHQCSAQPARRSIHEDNGPSPGSGSGRRSPIGRSSPRLPPNARPDCVGLGPIPHGSSESDRPKEGQAAHAIPGLSPCPPRCRRPVRRMHRTAVRGASESPRCRAGHRA